MAKTLKFGSRYLLFGDGAAPEVFSPLCGTTSWTWQINIEGNTTLNPNCTDPDLVAWLEYDESSKQMVFTSNGILDTDTMAFLEQWAMAGGSKNVRWLTEGTAANGGGWYQGEGFLTTLEATGERGQRWQQQYGVTISGEPVFTPTP